MTQEQFPEFRQLVTLTSDLEGALATARTELAVPEGFRNAEALEKIGMKHELFGFDRTYVEICEPLSEESSAGRSLAKKGDSGFMVVVQVADFDAMLARAEALGLTPLVSKDFHGSKLSQWHPRDFGTIAEFDEMRPADSWHFSPAVYDARGTALVQDIVAVDIAVADPQAMADRWATVSGGSVGADGASVQTRGCVLRFAVVENTAGPYSVDCRVADRSRVGETVRISGVDFRFV